MSDLQNYIKERKKKDPEFANNYDEGYKNFKIGAVLKQSRIEKGYTQEQLAKLLNKKNCNFQDRKSRRRYTIIYT